MTACVPDDLHLTMAGKTYDLNKFAAQHPGGRVAIECARGLPDATALFESYHPTLAGPKKVLAKYETGPSPVVFKTPHGYTFAEDGFYSRVRARVVQVQQEAGYGTGYWKAGPLNTMFAICHLLFLVWLRFALVAGTGAPHMLGVLTGFFRGLAITRTAHSASHCAFSPYSSVNRVACALTGISNPRPVIAQHFTYCIQLSHSE